MNGRHLLAFLWLRWRLLRNQWQRAGAVNAVLMAIVTAAALVTAIPLFIASLVLGIYLIPGAAPAHLLYAWDALIVAFLFFWSIGLVTELQRSEPLSLSKFLHLPVSVNGAFLINYLSSLLRLSLILFVPPMLGFALALVAAKGMSLLLTLPLMAAFLLMVTALTYQFQGWLAALMSNPRRRRTVVVAFTALFVLICQLPNLLNVYAPRGARERARRSAVLAAELKGLHREAVARQLNLAELERRRRETLEKYRQAERQANRESAERWARTARLANLLLPIGWLPLGVMTAAEGEVRPSLLGLLGMSAIGAGALWRAYRTTVRQYRGQPTGGKVSPAAPLRAKAVEARADLRRPGARLLEARIPGLSEPVSAIALGGLRALLRSPEAKMMLLTPLLMIVVFGTAIWNAAPRLPEPARPLLAVGAMVVVLFGMLQLMGNQFGFDRDGFRIFVLCSAPRRDILLGKNLAFAPLALGMDAALLPVVHWICPLRLAHLLAALPQSVSMFLLLCMLTNLLSICAPFYVPAGTMKPANPKLTTVLLQVLMFMFLFPLTQVAALLPLGIEALLGFLGWAGGVPVCLLLSLAECAAIVLLYRLVLGWQGALFQARELRILEVVAGRAS